MHCPSWSALQIKLLLFAFFIVHSVNIKGFHDSDVRHPRCVSYNSKGLRMEYAQSNTTIIVCLTERIPYVTPY